MISQQEINEWLSNRFSAIEKAPKMWGSCSQIEFQYIDNLEMWALINFGFKEREVMDRYHEFLSENYLIKGYLFDAFDKQDDIVYILKFFRELLEKEFNT